MNMGVYVSVYDQQMWTWQQLAMGIVYNSLSPSSNYQGPSNPDFSLQVKEKRGSRITNPQMQIYIGTGEESEILDYYSRRAIFPYIWKGSSMLPVMKWFAKADQLNLERISV